MASYKWAEDDEEQISMRGPEIVVDDQYLIIDCQLHGSNMGSVDRQCRE